jgi:hypothetical protein
MKRGGSWSPPGTRDTVDVKIRSTRTLKVIEEKISDEERANLAQLYMDPRYLSLVNVMERSCIALDTCFVNASVGQPEEVLGAHAVSKAAWLFFTYVQRAVLNCYTMQPGEEEEVAPPSLNDVLQGVG